MAHSIFGPEHLSAYGWGSLRLAALLWTSLAVDGGERVRWPCYVCMGCGRALLDAGLLCRPLLAGAAAAFSAAMMLRDAREDGCMATCVAKTLASDLLTGKRRAPPAAVLLLFWCLCSASAAPRYIDVCLRLFVVQLLCDMGERHLGHWTLFRQGFSLELASALLLAAGGLAQHELRVLQHDLATGVAARTSNFLLALAFGDALSDLARRCCARVVGLLMGGKVVIVTDAAVAQAVLRASAIKGDGVERRLAAPAWAPALSVESVDGRLHRLLLERLHMVLRTCPPASKVGEIAERRCSILAASGCVVDAEEICRLSAQVFVEYVFERDWEPRFECLVAASWEWRKEIAVKGKACLEVKHEAISLVVELLRGSDRLWRLLGEEWAQPEGYSAVLQPFLISPCINVGDIAVAMRRFSEDSVEDATRRMHPFPVLERFLTADVVLEGKLALAAGTQAIIFTADLASSGWPVFGSGPRKCAGPQLALPLLRAMRAHLLPSPLFVPEQNHRYSGRNNDAFSWREWLYFVKTVVPALLQGPPGDEEERRCR